MDDVAVPDGVTLTPLSLRPTRRLLVLLPLGVILFAAGANVGAGFLLVLAGGLVGCVPWAWFAARRAARTVLVRRELLAEVTAGEPVRVRLRAFAAATGSVVLRDELTGTVGVVEDPRSGGSLEGDAVLSRGVAVAGVVGAEVTDPLGLFLARVAGTVPSRVEVLPAPVALRPVDLVRAASRRSEQRPRRLGDGAETEGTREYRRGDPARSVHWRSSARREELVVRRLVGEASGRLRIVVEPGPWNVAALDRACAVVLAVADGADRGGIQVELAVGPHLVLWHPSTGRRLLAHLRPNLGSPTGDGSPEVGAPGLLGARDLERAVPADVVVHLRVLDGAANVEVEVDGTTRPVGVLSGDLPLGDVGGWLDEHLRGKAAA